MERRKVELAAEEQQRSNSSDAHELRKPLSPRSNFVLEVYLPFVHMLNGKN